MRKKEIELLSKTSLIKIANLCIVFAVPPVIALVIFATYVFNKVSACTQDGAGGPMSGCKLML